MFFDYHSSFAPYVFLLDTSESMKEEMVSGLSRKDLLNSFMDVIQQEIQANSYMMDITDIAVITFGDKEPSLVQTWVSGGDFVAPTLSAYGDRPLGESLIQALTKALDLCEKRKCYYKSVEAEYFRPYFFIVSDGESADDIHIWENCVRLANIIKISKKAYIVVVGIDGCSLDQLSQLSSFNWAAELSSFSIQEFFHDPDRGDFDDE